MFDYTRSCSSIDLSALWFVCGPRVLASLGRLFTQQLSLGCAAGERPMTAESSPDRQTRWSLHSILCMYSWDRIGWRCSVSRLHVQRRIPAPSPPLSHLQPRHFLQHYVTIPAEMTLAQRKSSIVYFQTLLSSWRIRLAILKSFNRRKKILQNIRRFMN